MARAYSLLILLLLAGCATPEPPRTDAPADLAWILVDPTGPGSEPMLAVDANGPLFLQAVGGTGRDVGESWAWRSDDGGATWAKLNIPTDASASTFDGAIAVDPDGMVWLANAFAARFTLYRSEDGGATWIGAATPPLPPMHRMWLAPSEDRLDVGLDSLGGPNFHFFSEDLAARTAQPVAPNYDVGGNLARRESDGLLLWPRHESAPMDRYVAWRSEDDGRTWTSVPITDGGAPETFPAAPARRTSIWTPTAFDRSGTAFFAVSAMAGGTSAVLLTRSLDAGLTWAPFVAVTLENETAALPWIAAREDGDIAIAAYAHNAPGAPDAPDAKWMPMLLRIAWPAAADAPEIERIPLPPRTLLEGALCTYGQACPEEQRPLGEFPAVAFTNTTILAAYGSPADAERFDSTLAAIVVPLRRS